MKRLKLLFAAVLLLLALPMWRFADLLAIASPFDLPLTMALILWFGIFIGIPLKLIFDKLQTYMVILLICCFASLAFWTNPLSKMATTGPELNHCGALTFTGTFYPARTILTDAYHDDLEARNQMCWVRKMISRVPKEFGTKHEVETYTKLVQEKLLRPEIKYRVALPLIAALYLRINTSSSNFIAAKNIYDSLHYYINHYTEEISHRQYSIWNWPHSDYIQFEYGLIEKNWQKLVDNIVITN